MTLFYIVILLQLLDLATTAYALSKGLGREGHRWLSIAIDRLGLWPALALTKGALIGGLYLAQPYVLDIGWYVIITLYVVVVSNNLRVIFAKH